ncbi:MAG: DUF3078 domain-containing protein [Balneolaceae bacterium]|nr:MAG: DUF3078 domain-containing protein [Balneolaceae bacterium]
MKTALLFLVFSFFFSISTTTYISAQDTVSIPDTLRGWDTSWELGLNGSQASYSNWSQGGVNNIAATGSTTFTTIFKKDRYSYGFLVNTRFGKTKIENEGIRKIDDRLYILNRFLYDLGEEDSDFKIFANIRFRTQFDKGYNYGTEPKELISNFLAPAYLTQDAGLAYIPGPMFSFEAGLGLQQTFVRDTNLSEKYGLSEGETFRNEAGLTLGSSFDANIATNIRFTSSINSFTSFNKPVKSTDIYFSNKFAARINRYLNTTFSVDLVYNDDFSSEIQVAQVLSLGVSFTIR